MIGRLDEKRLVSAFKWGFLSDRVVETIKSHNKGELLSNDDIQVMKKARELLQSILLGEQQYSNGKYSVNAIESFKIYNRSMNIISTEEFLSSISFFRDDSSIKELVTFMDNTFNNILKSIKLSTDELTISLNFFNMLRNMTLDESQAVLDTFYENRGIKKWAYPTESML